MNQIGIFDIILHPTANISFQIFKRIINTRVIRLYFFFLFLEKKNSLSFTMFDSAVKVTTVCGFELLYHNVSSFPLSYRKKNGARIENWKYSV